MNIRIALDLDDTILDFTNSYNEHYKTNLYNESSKVIIKKVYKLRENASFWSNLPLIERPNFIPTIYCTKRINSKKYTRNNLRKHRLPVVPIYQVIYQKNNKADYIKGICDVLIDDSPFNVRQCLSVGFPAILIDRPFNKDENLPRVHKLDVKEIIEVYNSLKDEVKRDSYRASIRYALSR